MNFTRTIGVMTLLTATLLGSCQKYEDGPAVSLTPREDRVANTWIIAYAEENGENVSDDFDQYELYLTTDRDATLTASYTAFGTDFNTTTNGTWNFTNDEENLRVDYEDDEQDNEFRILRLKSDELWLKDTDQDLELHLLPK
ncbi:MAG: lipocalin family protein [Flavobacteriales bacterium]|nr:lipocalin family protein [Flavobacteriales bacterium]